MSLRQAATQAAASKRDEQRIKAAADREKELADRHAFVVHTLSPLVTADDVTMTEPRVSIAFLQQCRPRPYERGDRYEVVEYDGTTFLADDLEVFVWRKDYRELRLHVLAGCAACGDPVLVSQSGSTPSQHWPAGVRGDEEYRRREIPKTIGAILAGSWLCARHKAAKLNARCETCGRPFGEDQ